MTYAFLPFKRLILFVAAVIGLIVVGRQAMHTFGEDHPYAVDVKRLSRAAGAKAVADRDWLALRGGRFLTQQRVERDLKSSYSRFYQILVPLVPANTKTSELASEPVRVIVLFDGDTRDEAVRKAREVMTNSAGGGQIIGTRAESADPREYFRKLPLADDCFVLTSGRRPWSWWTVLISAGVCLAAAGYGAWPMFTDMRDSRREAEEWEAAIAPPQRALPQITVGEGPR